MSTAVEPLKQAPEAGSLGPVEIRVKGRSILVPSAEIDGRTVVASGKWLKIAAVRDEELIEGDTLHDSLGFVERLKKAGLEADIFTFSERFPQTGAQSPFYHEWDSFAVIPISTYEQWWEHRAAKDVRTAVKKSGRLGVVVREVDLDDKFLEGVVKIYNECKYRQGKPFWHYGKDFDTVKRITSTYPDRSAFIAAYLEDELIGFIKMVRVGNTFATLHVISMKKYSNKKPTNALLAKAVEICAARGSSHLIYGNYIYKDPASSLTEFKRRNGFEGALVPRYYVPLTLKGHAALRMKLHRGLSGALPLSVWRAASKLRALAVRRQSNESD